MTFGTDLEAALVIVVRSIFIYRYFIFWNMVMGDINVILVMGQLVIVHLLLLILYVQLKIAILNIGYIVII